MTPPKEENGVNDMSNAKDLAERMREKTLRICRGIYIRTNEEGLIMAHAKEIEQALIKVREETIRECARHCEKHHNDCGLVDEILSLLSKSEEK